MSSIPASKADLEDPESVDRWLRATVADGLMYLLGHHTGYVSYNPAVTRLMIEKIHRCGWDPFIYVRPFGDRTLFEYPPISGWEVRYGYR